MKLSGWHVPIRHLSATSIGQLTTCPEIYRLRQIRRIPDSFGVEKFIGIVDHNTIAYNLQGKIDGLPDMTSADIAAMYDTIWDTELEGEKEPIWGDDEPDELKDHSREVMLAYHELVSPTLNPIRVEERFSVDIDDVPVPVIGYCDIEEEGRIIERKTSKSRVKKPKPRWLIQARIYSLVYDKPIDYHLSVRTKTPQVVTPEYEPALHVEPAYKDATVQLIQQAAYTLNDLWARYGPDRPWPQNGVHHDWMCSKCFAGPAYRNICPAWL